MKPRDVLILSLLGALASAAATPAFKADEPFVDPGACRSYASDAERRLDQRLAEEKKTPPPRK